MVSRTVSDVAMVMGREGWALPSRGRVMLRRKGSDSEEEEEREMRLRRSGLGALDGMRGGRGLALRKTMMVVVFERSLYAAAIVQTVLGYSVCKR